MKRLNGLIGWVLAVTVLFLTCTRETEPFKTDLGYNYFPLEIGHEITYLVDSITVRVNGAGSFRKDTNRFFLREIFSDTTRDAAGNLAYKIERFTRKDSLEAWVFDRVETAQRIDFQTFRTENDQRMLKLIHPMNRRSEWDGTAFLDNTQEQIIGGQSIDLFKGWFSEVDSIDVRRAVGAFVFDSTLVITQADYDDKVDRRFSKEIFVRGIGSVYREQKLLHSKCAEAGDLLPCEGKPWEEIASRGFVLRQTILSFK